MFTNPETRYTTHEKKVITIVRAIESSSKDLNTLQYIQTLVTLLDLEI